jgi:hypothetical protein
MAATTFTIKITLSGGVVTVNQDPVTAKPSKGDKVNFFCLEGEFAVLFKNRRSPFKSGEKAVAGNRGLTPTKELKVRDLTPSEKKNPGDPKIGDTFAYTVAVLDPATHNVVTLDPDIIIDDSGGGGGGNGTKAKKAKKKVKKAGKKKR